MEPGNFVLGDGETALARVSGSWRVQSDLTLGVNGGSGMLRIEDLGEVRSGSVSVGNDIGASGTASVSDAGAQWSASGPLYVGKNGTGSLDISLGQIRSVSVEIGYSATSIGTVTVQELESLWHFARPELDTGELTVGRDGIGRMTLTHGGQVGSTNAHVGAGAGSGVVEVGNYGIWQCGGDLDVGPGDAGTGSGGVTISDNGSINVNGALRLNRNGSLTLDKGGWLSVDQLLVNGGTFNWRGGNLDINESMDGNVAVKPGRTIGGFGTIYGDVVNKGTVKGSLRISGNYTQHAGAIFESSVYDRYSMFTGEPLGTRRRLVVTGRARILGGWVDPRKAREDQALDRPYSILSAEGGLSGRFDGVIQPAVAKFDLAYGPNDAYLIFRGRNTYVSQAATENQRAVASHFDAIGMSADGGDVSEILSHLDLLAQGELQQSFEQINPANYDAFTSASFDATRAYLASVAGPHGFMSALPAWTSASNAGGGEAVSLAGGEPLTLSTQGVATAPDSPNRFSLWASGISGWSGDDRSSRSSGYRVFTGGVAVGGDYRICPSLTAGISLGYTQADVHWLDQAGDGDIDTGYGSLYTHWSEDGFWGDAIVGTGVSWYDARRNISTFDRTADSDFTGQQYFGRVDGGHDWRIGKWTVGPTASFQYLHSQQDAFSETGADALNLQVDGRNASSLQSGLGLRTAYTLDLGGRRFTPSARAAWLHEYDNESRVIDASLPAMSDAQFRVRGNAPARDSAAIGLGLNAALTGDLALYVSWDMTLPLDGPSIAASTLTGGVQWRF